MNVAIGKFGSSILFSSARWYNASAPNEPPTLFMNLARLNPQNTYYIVGHTDFSRLKPEQKKKMFPNNNVVNVWENYDGDKYYYDVSYPYNYMIKNNIKIDFGIFYTGCLLKTNYKTQNYTAMRATHNYVGPIIHYLNNSNIKYFTCCADERFAPLGVENGNLDLINVEKFVLAMSNRKVDFLRPNLMFGEPTPKTVEIMYSGIETVILSGFEKRDPLQLIKTKKLITFFNNTKITDKDLNREKILKTYILNKFNDVDVIGNWDKEEKYKDDKRIKGFCKFFELQKKLEETKYTFIVPIKKDTISMKFWECLHSNVIPFCHKEYDTSKLLGFPEFLRIQDPQDLVDKINFLENNHDEYIKLCKQLNAMLTDDLYDFTRLNNTINDAIKKLNERWII